MADPQSVAALIELDIVAAAERYLPTFERDEDGVYRITGGEVSDEVIDRFVAEAETIFAFHLPESASAWLDIAMVTYGGRRIERRIERHPLRPRLSGLNMTFRVK